ncbi:MAG: UPF0182 family protein [bacterium]
MRKYIWWIVGIIFLALIPLIRGSSDIYVYWLWYLEIGYESIFLKVFFTGLKLGFLFGIVFFLFLLVNIIISDRITRFTVLIHSVRTIELPSIETLAPNIRLVILVASLFLSVVMGIEISSRWDLFLMFKNAVPFNVKEPVFNRDASFYVFKLPLLEYLNSILLVALIFSIIISIVVYSYKRGFGISPRGLFIHRPVYAHLSAMVGLVFLAKAWGYYLFQSRLLNTSRSIIPGAAFTDIHVRLPLLNALIVISVLAAVAFFINMYFRDWKIPAAAVCFVALASGVGVGIPYAVQQLRVKPNEIVLERPYIQRQIRFTRYAYDINNITEREVDINQKITSAELTDNPLTIRNVRLWDPRPLLSNFKQVQGIRTYYEFANVDIDRYYINGQYTQVMLSPRELSYQKLPSRIWINEHLTYTHGYGLCMNPVNTFTPEGMPDFFIKDIPPQSSVDINIDFPQIYYGEMTDFTKDFVFVNTKAKEFDYPLGAKNKFTTYGGTGGIPVSSLLRRVVFAIKYSSLPTLLNTDITTRSRILINRRIIERAQTALPLITYDRDPYMVIHEGRLVWILDGYTQSEYFPYSDRLPPLKFNYIRNSVKTVIDAYNGSIKIYIARDDDPIIQAIARIFPNTLKPLSQMPPGLREHLRYPQDIFRVQAEIYRVYQMTDPQVFYNKEDMWSIPNEIFYAEQQAVEPYYIIMKLPEEEKEEYILMLPFTPFGKDNLSAWLCARSDGTHYGELLVYKYPKKKLIYGPSQIEARVDQDSVISPQLSLWSQRGSNVIRGNLIVIPLGGSLLYVEPMYLQAEKGEIPELKRVIVAAGNKVVMEETLNAALSRLVSGDVDIVPAADTTAEEPSAPSSPGTPAAAQSPAERAREHLENARDALKQGDWKAFGEEMQGLEEILKKLQ